MMIDNELAYPPTGRAPSGTLSTHLTGGLARLRLPILAAPLSILAGISLAAGSYTLALIICLLPLLVWLLANPTLLLVPFAALIPAVQSLTGEQAGYRFSIGDLALVLVGAAVLLQTVVFPAKSAIRALRPVAFPVITYCSVLLLVLAAHPGVKEFLNTGQRYALLVLPLVIGAFAAIHDRHVPMLRHTLCL